MSEVTSKELEGELSEDEWELLYQEVQRRIDHQIEADERLQERASQLMRLVITTLGLALTAGSFAVSAFSPISLSWDYIDPYFIELSESTATLPHLHIGLSLVICAALLLAGVFSLMKAVAALIVLVPNHGLKVLSHKSFHPGLSTEEISALMERKGEISDEQTEVIESYIEKIQENQIYVEESQENWKNSYNSIWVSLQWLSLGGAFFLPFYIVREPIMVIASTLLLVFISIEKLSNYISYEDVVNNAHVRKDMDFGFLTLTIFFYLTIATNTVAEGTIANLVIGLITVIGLLSLVLTAALIEKEPLMSYSVRTLAISILALIFYFIFSFNLPTGTGPMDVEHVRVPMSITIGGVYTMVFIGFGISLKAIGKWIMKVKKLVNEWDYEDSRLNSNWFH